jgi:NADPH2:quinone reductase
VKAAVYHRTGPPEVLQYEDVADPNPPGPGEVLIEVEAISIEGGDTLNRAGGLMPNGAPHVVGYQCAGTIRAVGDGVTDRHEGQRVVATMPWGSHAALAVTPALVTWVVPDGADIVAAACVPVAFGTAHDCLFEFGRLAQGETVLIHAGAGGVGVGAIQMAARAGATVVATASSDERLHRLRDLGLDHGINYATHDFVTEVRRLTDGRGADVIVDSVGGETLARSLEALAYRGRVVSVGDAGRGPKEPLDVSTMRPNNQTFVGYFLGAELFSGTRAHAMIAGLIDDVGSGSLRAVIDRTFPLAEAAEAHRYIESRQALGRVVLNP